MTRVAYLVSRFPLTTETFIVRELDRVAQVPDMDVELLSLFPAGEQVVHEEARRWVGRARRASLLRGAFACARELVRAPRTVVRIVARVVADHVAEPRVLAKALVTTVLAFDHAAIVRRRKVDHLHAHFATYPALAAWVISGLTGISYSVTPHAHDIFVSQRGLRTRLGDAAAVVAVSDYHWRFLQHFGASPDRLSACPTASISTAMPSRRASCRRPGRSTFSACRASASTRASASCSARSPLAARHSSGCRSSSSVRAAAGVVPRPGDRVGPRRPLHVLGRARPGPHPGSPRRGARARPTQPGAGRRRHRGPAQHADRGRGVRGHDGRDPRRRRPGARRGGRHGVPGRSRVGRGSLSRARRRADPGGRRGECSAPRASAWKPVTTSTPLPPRWRRSSGARRKHQMHGPHGQLLEAERLKARGDAQLTQCREILRQARFVRPPAAPRIPPPRLGRGTPVRASDSAIEALG